MEYFGLHLGSFKVLKKLFREQSNIFKTRFINCLVDCVPCLFISFIGIFHVCLHYLKVRICYVGDFILSCNRNKRFRVDTCLCINMIRIFPW